MKLVDLFSGCGGFSAGATSAGLDIAAAYDIDPILASSFPVNFPRTKHIIADVSKLSAATILADTGFEVDGVFGGPPCQGFSSIGKRSTTDPRRLLLGHFFRLVGEISPKFFVMENVVGLNFGNAREVLDTAMSVLGSGYSIFGPTVLCASSFGAATKRPRLFVLGIRNDLNLTFTLEDLDPYLSEPATVEDAISDLLTIVRTDEMHTTDRWRIVSDRSPSKYALKLRSIDLTFTGNIRTKHSVAVANRFAAVKQGQTEKIGRHPRLAWSGHCPTLRAGTGSDKGSFQSVRPIHPVENRVITVREAARLQGFQDDHIFHPTIWHSFRMIGNSVSPIIANAIFSAVKVKIEKGAHPPNL